MITNATKQAARIKAGLAKSKGLIIIPDRCEQCPNAGPLQMHHDRRSLVNQAKAA